MEIKGTIQASNVIRASLKPQTPYNPGGGYDDTELRKMLADRYTKEESDGKYATKEAVSSQKEEIANLRKEIEDIDGGVSDVKIGDASIVTDGVATLPNAKDHLGVCKVNTNGMYGVSSFADGELYLVSATTDNISRRNYGSKPITPTVLDYAVKQAMCDGKGAEWTDEEKASARERLGIKVVTQAEYDDIIGADSDGCIYLIKED